MRVSKILLAVTLLVGIFGLQNVVMASEVDETTTVGSEDKPVAEISQPVNAFFPDPGLATEIAEELDLEGIVPGCTVYTVVTDTQLGMIESLDAQSAEIISLVGMEYLTGANSINLSYNDIVNLYPLAGLVNLDSLFIAYNQILSDLTPLSNLTNLTTLGLSGNRISDVEPISNLTNLEALYLNDNSITDISSLGAVLSDITYCDLESQDVLLPVTAVGDPTYVVIENTDGVAPEVIYVVGQGMYNEDTELLTWSTVSTPLYNELYWSETIPGTSFQFSGTIYQEVTLFSE